MKRSPEVLGTLLILIFVMEPEWWKLGTIMVLGSLYLVLKQGKEKDK